jgi:hypothetical protein
MYQPSLSIGDSISGAFEVYRNNFMAFFGFWAIPAILGIVIALAQLFLFGGQLESIGNTNEGDMPDLGGFFALLGISIGFILIIWIINILFIGGLIGMTKEAMSTGRTSSGKGFRTINNYFGSILVTGIVVFILLIIGTMLCCIPGILFCYWWMFAITAVVVEGVGMSEGMARSKEFASSRQTIGFAIVIIVIAIVISIISAVVATSISIPISIALGNWAGSIVTQTISSIITWILYPFIFVAVAYHYIKGKGLDRPGGPPGMPPGVPPPPPGAVPPPPGYSAPPPGY